MSTITINKVKIPQGKNEHIEANVGSLASGTKIKMHIHVHRAAKPGPVMLITGGVHGDEINGIEIVRRATEEKMFDNLIKGTIIAIPIVNVYGFNNFSRDTPDGKDVNRSFPGSISGGLSSRVARSLTKEILPIIDMGLDFHTGGAARYNYPQVRYTPYHKKSIDLAKAFGAPFTIASTPLAKSWRKVAMSKDTPILVFEGGESKRYDGLTIQKGLEGLKRTMHTYGFIKGKAQKAKTIEIKKMTWQRASKPGMFRWTQKSGDKVQEGEQIGVINDPYGHYENIILSKKTGYIVGHNNAPVVSLGDPLFHIGYDWD